MISTRERARNSDAEARDAIARLLDSHLACVPQIRTISARLLTRSLARDERHTAAQLAANVHLPGYALTSSIQRRGGASMKALRDEIMLTRLAYCFRDRRVTWIVVSEVVGVPHLNLLRRIVRKRRRLAPSRWRLSVTSASQLNALDSFLVANAPRWKAAIEAHNAPRKSGAT